MSPPVPVVYAPRAIPCCAQAPGACGHPAFPAPSLFHGGRDGCKARAQRAARTRTHVLRCPGAGRGPISRVFSLRQSGRRPSPNSSLWLWVPACAGTTAEYAMAFSRRYAPEVCMSFHPPQNRGRREGRVAACTRGLTRNKELREARRPQVQAVTTGLPRAMVLRLIRALPGEPSRLPPSPREHRASQPGRAPRDLRKTWRQGLGAPEPHDFAVREPRHQTRKRQRLSPSAVAS